MSKEKIFAIGKKLKARLSTRQGSILAYSLVILFMMLAVVTGLSTASILGKKSASGTEFSIQSLQTADSGVQFALKKVNTELQKSSPGSIDTAFGGGSCAGNTITSINGAAGPIGSTFELSFFDKSGTQLACSSNVSQIDNIKAVGTYKNTVRAVEVAVAAPTVLDTYQTVCATTANTRLACCQINQNTGATNCKSSGDGTTWINIGSPWPAGTAGRYNVTCAMNNAAFYCCKSDATAGTSATCRQNNALTSTWSNFGSNSPW